MQFYNMHNYIYIYRYIYIYIYIYIYGFVYFRYSNTINYIRFMHIVASHIGVHQESLSESTVMGNGTLHVQVSRMQCNDVYVAMSFQSLRNSHLCIDYFDISQYG